MTSLSNIPVNLKLKSNLDHKFYLLLQQLNLKAPDQWNLHEEIFVRLLLYEGSCGSLLKYLGASKQRRVSVNLPDMVIAQLYLRNLLENF